MPLGPLKPMTMYTMLIIPLSLTKLKFKKKKSFKRRRDSDFENNIVIMKRER